MEPSTVVTIADKYSAKKSTEVAGLEERHLNGEGGFKTCLYWSDFLDSIIIDLLKDISDGSGMDDFSLIALGGYGRRELCPKSDIDLLFLYGNKTSFEAGKIHTKVIPTLWDIGFKVGHSTRTLDDCIAIAEIDLTSKTAMMEARFMTGNVELYEQFTRLIRNRSINKNRYRFLKSKLFEMEIRHQNFHNTVFLTEPNIKESPGGLRDYHTALWVANAQYGVTSLQGFEKRGLAGKAEMEEVTQSVDFLLKIRNDLHFLQKNPDEVLTYSLQPRIAERLGYKGEGDEAVKELMRDYYRSADVVHRFSTSIIDQAKRYGVRTSNLIQKIRHKKLAPNIYAGPDEIYIKDLSTSQIAIAPEPLFTIFSFMTSHGLKPSHRLMKTLHELGGIWKNQPPPIEKISTGFRTLLENDNPAEALRILRDTKILTAIIPEFHTVRYLTPFDLYHRFTVDDHTFRAIQEFDRLPKNERSECNLLRSIYSAENRKDLVRLALLLHDIGKGYGTHQEEEEIDPEIVRRLGYSEKETEDVITLVRHHILMNLIAQRRDIHDESVINDFCEKIKTEEMLTRLYMITFADTSAVGPEVWNSWKGSLLKDLFLLALKRHETEQPAEAQQDIIEEFKINLAEKEARFAGGMPDRYYLIRDSKHATEDAKLYNEFISLNESVVIGTRYVSANEPGEITIVAKNKLGLLYRLLGTFASKNISILDSQIFTRKDGIVLDIFRIAGKDGKPVTDETLLSRIKKEIKKIVDGESNVEDLLRQRKKMIALGDDLPHVEPSIDILNDVSLEHTVIEVVSRDRIGLLYDIAREQYENGAEIVTARISTEGHRAVNAFYVSELDGKKIFHSDRVKEIKKALLSIL